MTTRTAIHDRVAEAILDATADLFAEGGEPPSMSDVAGAAGISRATLYRYFPTREQLLEALAAIAIDTTATGLAQADLDAVPVPEGIARIARVPGECLGQQVECGGGAGSGQGKAVRVRGPGSLASHAQDH